MNYPKQDAPSSPENVKFNDIIAAGNANKFNFGSNFDLSKGPAGMTVKPVNKSKSGMVWRDTYNPTGSYDVNETIFEATASSYTDEFGVSRTSEQGSWVCTQFIPYQYTTLDRASINASNVPAAVITSWLRQSGVNYLPSSNSSYWKPLGSGGGASVSYNIYDYSSSYSQNTFIRTNTTVQYSNGTSSKWQYPGVWIVRQTVAALSGSYPSGSRGTNFQVPVYPTGSYYDLIAMSPSTMSMCVGGPEVMYWVHGQQIEPSGSTIVRI